MPRPQGTRSYTSAAAEKALKALGVAVRRERERREWTLDALSEATGLDPAYLGRVEAGKVNVTFRTLHRIASGLGVTIKHLAG